MPTHTSQTLDRGLLILEFLGSSTEDRTISDIAAALDIHRTIAHRLLATLQQRQFVSRSPIGRYRLGTRLIGLASTIGGELRSIARPVLSELNEETQETVHLVVLTGSDVLFIDAFESPKALRVASRVGRSLPAYATSVGKALLAQMTDDDVKALYPGPRLERVASNTMATRSELLKQLEGIREQGYAISNEESEDGVGSVGVAVCDRTGAARAAISVAAPLQRLAAEQGRLIAAARLAAGRVGSNL